MRRGIWFVLLLVILVAAASGLKYWRTRSETAPAPKATETPALANRLIATAEPVERTFTLRVPWTGLVQSNAAVELTALVAGRVEAIEAADEMPVAAGAPVLTLGGPLLTAQQAKLEIGVESLQAQLALASQTVQQLQQNVAQRLATRSELAAAQAEQLKLQAQLQDAQRQLQSWGAQTRVIAPTAGVFTDRRVSVGQAVQAGAVLGAIVDPNHLRIVAALFAPEGAPLVGKEASVRLTQERVLSGVVRRIEPQASDTGATMAWIEGPQIDRELRPGQTVAGEVTVDVRPSLAVPESAVLYDAREQSYVLVAEQGRYEPRGVRVGLTENGWVEILAGLQKGQTVVTAGAYEIANSEFSRQFRVED
jgi:RND family efflux transporter MFP subunit